MAVSLGFAAPSDMEPGMWFRERPGADPLLFGGVDPVRSRFPGRHRVRVIVLRGGRSFVTDAARKFQLVRWQQ